MGDYSAATIQPIAQGLLTIDAAGDPVIVGQGFASVERGVNPAGDFLVTLDSGTVAADINSGAVAGIAGGGNGIPDGNVGPNGLDPRLAHVTLTMRGGVGGIVQGATTISNLSASFVNAPGTGALQISIQTAATPALGGQVDPSGAGAPNVAGSGLEIMVWKLATPDNVTQQSFGPMYTPVIQFP
jgi:hypothetical protein